MTPHPWMALPRVGGGYVIGPLSVVGYAVAIVPKNRRPDAEAKTNARLIAAAPDMLEALKKIEEGAKMHGGAWIAVAHMVASKAIAKATEPNEWDEVLADRA